MARQLTAQKKCLLIVPVLQCATIRYIVDPTACWKVFPVVINLRKCCYGSHCVSDAETLAFRVRPCSLSMRGHMRSRQQVLRFVGHLPGRRRSNNQEGISEAGHVSKAD